MLKASRRYNHIALTLVVVASLWLSVPSRIRPVAAAGRSLVGEQGGEKGERQGPPGPCEQALTIPGNANGLNRRCEAIGTGGGAAKGDFNGDGFADLAVGVPNEDQNGLNAVGGVNIIYGSAAGLTATGDQFLDEVTFGFTYASNDHFGSALASGDFNGDGFSDLAIGMPDRDVDEVVDAGRVLLIDGSVNGLNTSTARTLSLLSNRPGRAGAALVWADFNGDGLGDLAVGIPNASDTFQSAILCLDTGLLTLRAGEVQVFFGRATGLSQTDAQRFQQGPRCAQPENVGLESAENDHFGAVLAAGNFHGGLAADLVIGMPFKNVSGQEDAGLVLLIPGGLTGLKREGTQELNQDTPGVGGAAEAGDEFGRALATGDFNGDGRDDLAVGTPFEDLESNNSVDAGAVQVFFGTTGDLVTTSGSLFISQAVLSGQSVEAGDRFGWALAVGDFDSDGRGDLAIGVPGEDIGVIADAGLVHVLYGSSSGPSLSRFQSWTQDSAGVPDSAEVGDQFGYALSAWNYGNGGESDLAIGVPFEDVLSAVTGTQQVDAGAVNLIYGNLSGLNATARAAQFWHQDSSGINDTAQPGDRFGSVLY